MSASRCVVFDLDGTLADTVRDIANSVNLTRADYHLDPLPLDVVVSFTGDGARKLLERSFAGHPIDWDEGIEKMIRHYFDYPVVHTTLYLGVAEGLAALKNASWRLAVVTNKPGLVAREILEKLGVARCFDDLVGGGDGFPLKPDPAVMLHLMKKYDASPAASWVLGDNHTDLDSAAGAGMNAAFAAWGFGFSGESRYTIRTASFSEFTQYLLEN